MYVMNKNFQSILDNAAMRKPSDRKYYRFLVQCRFSPKEAHNIMSHLSYIDLRIYKYEFDTFTNKSYGLFIFWEILSTLPFDMFKSNLLINYANAWILLHVKSWFRVNFITIAVCKREGHMVYCKISVIFYS